MGGKRLYENVVIGNFLYGLGFALGARRGNDITASAVSLLQQSPADKLLGDVLLEFTGVVRLIEFKTESNRSKKEPIRRRKLEASLARREDLKAVSRVIHWYVESASTDGIEVGIVPYLDAFADSPLPLRKEDRLETFIDQTAQEIAAGTPKVSQEAAQEYLDWVRRTLGGGEVGTGGLLLVAGKDGVLRYAQLLDLQELRLQDRQWMLDHAQRLDRELAYQRELNRQRDRGRARSRKPHSLEMER